MSLACLLVSPIASSSTQARCILCSFLAEGVFNLLIVTVWNVMMEALILHTMNMLIDLSHLLPLSVMSKDTHELFSGPNENCNG